MYEPLEGKRYEFEDGHIASKNDKDGNWIDLDELKSAVRFYKRYKNNPLLLYKERRDLFDNHFDRTQVEGKGQIAFYGSYQDKLFNIAFKDAVEKK